MSRLTEWKQAAMRRGFRLLADPRVTRLIADPRVMNAVLKAFQLRGRLDAAVEESVARFARRMNLATRDDVERLESTIAALEARLAARPGAPSDVM